MWHMKKLIIFIAVIIIAGIGGYFLFSGGVETANDGAFPSAPEGTVQDDEQAQETQEAENGQMSEDQKNGGESIIGTSAGGRDITAYHYGAGDTELLFVGGIHGGYEWNTVLLAYEIMDHLKENPDVIPENIKVTIIPVLNPDGLHKTVGTDGRFAASDVPQAIGDTVPGRFNANDVDLNRNFNCDWQAQGTWQSKTVSGGTEAFSEPEAQAMKDYVQAHSPSAAVVYYSAAGGVFASNCHNGILPETRTIMNTYAGASGYRAYEDFDFYKITGDMVNWLAGKNIPAISVLLTNHTDIEFEKNRKGVEALLKHYAE